MRKPPWSKSGAALGVSSVVRFRASQWQHLFGRVGKGGGREVPCKARAGGGPTWPAAVVTSYARPEGPGSPADALFAQGFDGDGDRGRDGVSKRVGHRHRNGILAGS